MTLFKNLKIGTKLISAYLFCQKKIFAMDRIERMVQKVRAVEVEKGTANRI